jgi:hypothetical protein
MHDFGERAELTDQGFGQWLDVAARQGAKQHHFQQFVIAQGIGADAAEALAKTLAMALVMRRRFGKSRWLGRLIAISRHRRQRTHDSSASQPCRAG